MSDLSTRPWLAQYAPGVPSDIEPTDETLSDLLDDAVARFADRSALDFYGRITTYAELGDQVARAAGALRDLGVGEGRPRRPGPAELPAARGRLLRGAAARRHRRRAQPALHDRGARHPVRRPRGDGRDRVGQDRAGPDRGGGVHRARDDRRGQPHPGAAARQASRPAAARREGTGHARGDDGQRVPGTPVVGRARSPAPTPIGTDHPRPTADDIAALQYTGRDDRRAEGRDAHPPQPARQRRAGPRLGPGTRGRRGGRLRPAPAVPRLRPDPVPDLRHQHRRDPRAVPALRRPAGARGHGAPPRDLPAGRAADVPGPRRRGPQGGRRPELRPVRDLGRDVPADARSSTTGRRSPAACSSRATA